MSRIFGLVLSLVFFSISTSTWAVVIIDDTTGGLYNSSLGDMADYYGPSHFPNANSSEGDPNYPSISEPTVFGAAFGTDWLGGDYTGGSWGAVANIPNTWAVNHESAVVYDFVLGAASDIHIDLGVDNGIYVWLDGTYLFGAMQGGGSNINEYNIDLAGVASGAHSLQILREDHGGGTGMNISVDVTDAPVVTVSEPSSFALFSLGLIGLMRARKRYASLNR
ncbi:hypothetical protein A9Q99_19240 [Gammaproteobacteria bacterium 45_16_T64]|nr:hypothetical protein A9Q99_19240 [Gammaproteobacteria bacterium 45_16_T64]